MHQISAQELHRQLQSEHPPALLDVREAWEVAICSIEGAIECPMNALPSALEELPRDRELVVFCHVGMRSAYVVRFLQTQGFDKVINLSGGIAAWARDVDPTMKAY